MELIDTHCHLQFDAFSAQENQVLARASASGVKKIICVGTTLTDSHKAVELATGKKDVWASAGVHPHAALSFLADPNAPKKLKELLGHPRVVAVGEVGLDLYREPSALAEQEQALRSQIEVGLAAGKPFIFHVRDAWNDFWRIYDEYKFPVGGLIHSFSAGPKQLEQILRRGLYVGLNGIMTFSRDESQLTAARVVRLNRLVLETDAPFLTPAPNRNELCEPRHVRVIAEFLAELRGESLADLARDTTANATKLFGL